MPGVMGISVSALSAAQIGLQTTGHNIANANTPGFSRQEIVQGTRIPNFSGSGFIGQGVSVETVKRAYSQFLSGQVLTEQSQAAMLSSYHAQLQQIDNVIADPEAGISPAIQDFFTAINNVSSAPESSAARQAMLNTGSALSERFQSMGERLTEINKAVGSQVSNSLTLVNGYSKQIAMLNNNIVMLQASSTQPPNDLLDQRDQLVAELNKQIKTSVVRQSDGAYNVFIGNGQSLVVGGNAFTMATEQSPVDPSKEDVIYLGANGVKTTLQQSSLQGGNLGGLLAFRDVSLADAQNSLGRVAMGIAGVVNHQNQLGQDLNGDLGGNFFVQPQPAIYPNMRNNGAGIVTASIKNASDYANLTGSDYSLRFDGGTKYTLIRLSDHKETTFANGLPSSPVDGLTLTVSADAKPGDTYLIRPTVNGSRDIAVGLVDPSKIAAATPVRTNASISNQGSGKIEAATVTSPQTPDPNHPLTDLNLRSPVTIKFTSASTFDVVDGKSGAPLAQGKSYLPGENISFNGWSTRISGNPASGDTFTIGPNLNATADSSNALLMANLQTSDTLGAPAGGTPTMTFQGAYAQWVSNVGNKTHELQVTSTAQTAMAEETVAAQQSFGGVNLDEEAANLMRYQRAYQAAGKAMQIANSMFDTILEIGR